jgi:hypothetical protein
VIDTRMRIRDEERFLHHITNIICTNHQR